MKYENIEYGDDKDNPGSGYVLTNTINGMKYYGETGKPLRKYIHENYVLEKGHGRGLGTGGIADALIEYGHEVFTARRIFWEPDHYQRLLKESQAIIENDAVMNGYNRKVRGGGPSQHHPSSIDQNSKSNKEVYENLSEEEKLERKRIISDAWKNKSQEEKNEIVRKREETKANKTPEEKEEIARKMIETIENKSQEEKEEIARKISVGNLGKTFSLETIQKRAKTNANKTPEEKEEISRKISRGRKGKKLNGPNKNKGRKQTSESIRKIKETKTNKSPEEKEKEKTKYRETKKKNKLKKELEILRLINLPMPDIKNKQVNRKIFTGFDYMDINPRLLYLDKKKNGNKKPRKIISSETRKKQSESRIGKKQSEETIRKREETKANKTPEEKSEIIRKIVDTQRKNRELRKLKL